MISFLKFNYPKHSIHTFLLAFCQEKMFPKCANSSSFHKLGQITNALLPKKHIVDDHITSPSCHYITWLISLLTVRSFALLNAI